MRELKIDKAKCLGCGRCIPYCPARAISLESGKARIDQEKCLECGNCIRKRTITCPVDAIYEPEESRVFPRNYRRFYSDPSVKTPSGLAGRGTDEVKTNDVSGRVKRGELGIAVEMGRPVLGTSMRDVEKVTTRLASLGVSFEADNPLIALLEDPKTGKIRPDLMQERIVSVIVETKVPFERGEEVLCALREVSREIDTVFSLDLICCYDEDGTLPALRILEKINMPPRQNAKVNLGLGRPLAR